MRMFVALQPPDHVVEDLAEFLEPRRQADPDLRWSAPDQWHLTLAFLPTVLDRQLDELLDQLAQAAARRTTFALSLAGSGAFPDVSRAKVLYAGVQAAASDGGPTEELARLATNVRAGSGQAGVAVDGARFHPHLTLARCGRPRDLTRWAQIVETYRSANWPVEEITVFESRLGQGPGGRALHEAVASLPLSP